MHILRLCTTTVLSFLSIGLGGVELTINTDRQDRVIPIYPPKCLFAGYKNTDIHCKHSVIAESVLYTDYV